MSSRRWWRRASAASASAGGGDAVVAVAGGSNAFDLICSARWSFDHHLGEYSAPDAATLARATACVFCARCLLLKLSAPLAIDSRRAAFEKMAVRGKLHAKFVIANRGRPWRVAGRNRSSAKSRRHLSLRRLTRCGWRYLQASGHRVSASNNRRLSAS